MPLHSTKAIGDQGKPGSTDLLLISMGVTGVFCWLWSVFCSAACDDQGKRGSTDPLLKSVVGVAGLLYRLRTASCSAAWSTMAAERAIWCLVVLCCIVKGVISVGFIILLTQCSCGGRLAASATADRGILSNVSIILRTSKSPHFDKLEKSRWQPTVLSSFRKCSNVWILAAFWTNLICHFFGKCKRFMLWLGHVRRAKLFNVILHAFYCAAVVLILLTTSCANSLSRSAAKEASCHSDVRK